MLDFIMKFDILFDQPLDPKTHYISPGGYEMRMNGRIVTFDFTHFEGYIDKENPCLLHMEQSDPDTDTFPDLEHITVDDLRHVEGIEEFLVYTGEWDDPELYPVELLSLSFEVFYPNDRWGEWDIIPCPQIVPYRFDAGTETKQAG